MAEPGESTGTLLAALALFAAVVLMLKKAREQQEEMAKRAEQLLMDYPSLIMKFTLSDPGRYDGSQSISEDQFRLSEKLSERRTICI